MIVAVTTLPTFIATFGIDTLVMTGPLASMGSLACEMAVVYVALGLVAGSAMMRLTGMFATAATSVPPLVTVNCAV